MKKLLLILLCLPFIGFGQTTFVHNSMQDMYIQMFWSFIIAFIIMLLLREVFCWYWKINDIKKIIVEQKNMLRNIEYSTTQSNKFLKIIAEKDKGLSESIIKDNKKKTSNLQTETYPDDHPLKQ